MRRHRAAGATGSKRRQQARANDSRIMPFLPRRDRRVLARRQRAHRGRVRRRDFAHDARRRPRLVQIRAGAESRRARRPVRRRDCRASCRRRQTPACPRGSTARHARSAAGGSASAGNILSPSAPAASAANASVGVATPGTHSMPLRLRRANHGEVGVRHHDDRARPPRGRARRRRRAMHRARADEAVRTPCRSASRRIDSNARGELSGTSSTRKPLRGQRVAHVRRPLPA